MTTIAVDARTFRLQLELRVERRPAARRASSADLRVRARRADDRTSAARAHAHLDDLRTAALAQRLPGF